MRMVPALAWRTSHGTPGSIPAQGVEKGFSTPTILPLNSLGTGRAPLYDRTVTQARCGGAPRNPSPSVDPHVNTETPVEPTLTCPHCTTTLVAKGVASGTWLRCPGCGRPVQFRDPVKKKPAPPPPPPLPEPDIAPARPPWTTATEPKSSPSVPTADDLPTVPPGVPWYIEPRQVSRRSSLFQIFVLAILSGFAQGIFVRFFLGRANGSELFVSWIFGFLMAWIIGMMTAGTGRPGDL